MDQGRRQRVKCLLRRKADWRLSNLTFRSFWHPIWQETGRCHFQIWTWSKRLLLKVCFQLQCCVQEMIQYLSIKTNVWTLKIGGIYPTEKKDCFLFTVWNCEKRGFFFLCRQIIFGAMSGVRQDGNVNIWSFFFHLGSGNFESVTGSE